MNVNSLSSVSFAGSIFYETPVYDRDLAMAYGNYIIIYWYNPCVSNFSCTNK